MHTIRFENTAHEHKDLAGKFLQSLQLDPKIWLEEQSFELKPEAQIEVFGMQVEMPEAVIQQKEWVCQIDEKDCSLRFEVSGYLVGARVSESAVMALAVEALHDNLEVLSLVGCSSLSDLSPLSGLPHITSLDLTYCESLRDLSPLSGLTRLTSLKLAGCSSLCDLTPLSGLTRLRSLNLLSCSSLSDLSPLSGLTSLITLNLARCRSLNDLNSLSGLTLLRGLNLFSWSSLSDLNPLSGLTRLTSLNLAGCSSLCDLTPLSGLTCITSLYLAQCSALSDLSPLSGLTRLTSLDLKRCDSLTDLSPLGGLTRLNSLFLARCSALNDLSPLSVLTRLTSLDLASCRSLNDLSPLGGLTRLNSLNLASCSALSDLSDLRGLTGLTDLNLENCDSLSDLSGLSGLPSLTSLNLASCSALSDLSDLRGLTGLTDLNLENCGSVSDLSGLSGLPSLTSLNLRGCDNIRSLNPLTGLNSLQALTFTSRRIPSIAPLREIAALRDLEKFNPPEVFELLAHTAVLRSDRGHISKNAKAWLQEASNWEDGSPALQDRFATTLGEAFSLLGEHEIEQPYEAYLQSKPDFSSAPWKAWFEGTRMQSSPELMRRRIERQDITRSTPGCIGGVCSIMPDERGSDEAQNWGRDWLARMEASWQTRAKELLPVSAEMCLAHARLGLKEALNRWLERFTDPSDFGLLDPVHAALGYWQMGRGGLDAAGQHAALINEPRLRNPLLGQVALGWRTLDPDRAGETLLMIEDAAALGELLSVFAADESFVSSERNVQRLVVAAGDSPTSLASLLGKLHPKAHPSMLEELSRMMRAQETEGPI